MNIYLKFYKWKSTMINLHTFLVLSSLVWIQKTSGLKCLSCPDVTHPQLCRQTVTCSAGETCGMEKFISRGGDVRFSLDCVANGACIHHGSNSSVRSVHNTGNIPLCSQCCHGDLCNSGGCGESNFQELGATVCYQCQYKLAHEECTTIDACDADEICYIEETSELMQTYFNSGCRRKTICDALNNPGTAVGRKKREDLCVHCCRSFLCNKKCGEVQCVDKPECTSLISNYQICADVQSASHMCPKSCGLCETDTNTTTSDCKDISQNCEYLESRFKICQDNVTVDELGCHKTCGLCGQPQIGQYQTTTELPITKTDTSGTQFVFALTENFRHNQMSATLYIVSEGATDINVTIPHLRTQDRIHIKSMLEVYHISSKLMPSAFVNEGKGILVESSAPVYLFVLNEEAVSSDGFNVLPFNQLSNRYIVPTSTPFYISEEYQSKVVIVSAFDENNVTFRINTTGSFSYNGAVYRSGDDLDIVLHKLETFEIAHRFSLSGSKIVSTKPVAVISGNECNRIESGPCSHMSDMIPPVVSYDNLFVIPKHDNQKLKIQIMAGKNNTDVTITSNATNTVHLQQEGDLMELEISSTVVLSATKGVLVTQFMYGYDPCMMTVPGISQYLSNYTFGAFLGSGSNEKFSNYITVIIRSSAVHGLFLDGRRLQNTISSVLVENVWYDYFVTSISPGYHNMYHEHGVTFAVYVFGKRRDDRYCYSAGKYLINPP